MANQEPFEDGFNLRAIIAALFIGFVILPGAIYLGLMTGGGLGSAAQWVTLILFIEVAKRSFVTLKRQEIYIIYLVCGILVAPGLVMGAASLVLQGGAFSEKIWQQYLVQSPFAKAYGLTEHIPHWIIPPAGSECLIKRTFFDKAWLFPIGLLIFHHILFRFNFFGLGYVLFRLTSDREKLSFPMAPVAAEGATALADASAKKESWRWRVFSIGAMIGAAYGAIYIIIPTLTGVVAAKPLMLIPIPWIDFTDRLGSFLPTAMLGIMTDLTFLFMGFLLPFWVVVGLFTGSIGAKVIISPILYRYTNIMHTWKPGMAVIPTNVSTQMDLWISVTIGVGLVVALVGIYKLIASGFRERKNRAAPQKLPEGRGDMPVWLALGIWAVSTTFYVVVCHRLVPDFPLWIFAFFGFILTPLLSYMSARMFGITGSASGIAFPMVREGSLILGSRMSNYSGAGVWFAPLPYFNHGLYTQRFKELELTRTKFTSWYKAEFAALGIMLLCSFIYWSVIWRMAPIPSTTYPFVNRMWPMSAIFSSLWATSTIKGGVSWMLDAIKVKYILGGLGGGFLLYSLISFLNWPIAFFYGIIGGISFLPHQAIPMFIGALLGRYYLSKKFGEKTWKSYAPILLAGYACGAGLLGMISAALALIAKVVTPLVF